jgi:hypothetical protein
MTAMDRTGSLLPVLAFQPERQLFFCADQTLAFDQLIYLIGDLFVRGQ